MGPHESIYSYIYLMTGFHLYQFTDIEHSVETKRASNHYRFRKATIVTKIHDGPKRLNL